ncbi:general stress protein [Lysinibacillus sp. NPDC097287]|uniref:general stress protein n=1 Tax=Lysinibacillus sp. NPDC097287 TaxID=3364144 RepID=UPI00382ED411
MKNEQNQRIEVAHSQEEMLRKLDSMRRDGINYQDINIITRDTSQFEDVKEDADVKTHAAGNLVDQFKSWFTGDSAVTEGLKRFDLTDGQIAYYGQLLEHGAIVLFAEQGDNLNKSEPFIDTIDHAANSVQRENSSRID